MIRAEDGVGVKAATAGLDTCRSRLTGDLQCQGRSECMGVESSHLHAPSVVQMLHLTSRSLVSTYTLGMATDLPTSTSKGHISILLLAFFSFFALGF